jgi:hypothetical protein
MKKIHKGFENYKIIFSSLTCLKYKRMGFFWKCGRWEINTHEYGALIGIYSPPWELKAHCWDDHNETWDHWYATSWKLFGQTKF